MSKIVQSFYGPLHTLFCSLVCCFPEDECLRKNLAELRGAVDECSDTLFLRLLPGLTVATKNAFLARDADRFFSDPPNVLVEFIGGRRIYECLDSSEQAEYWGEVLDQVIRQGLLLKAIAPKLSSINSIVESLVRSQDPGAVPPTIHSTVKKILSSEDLLSNVLNLVRTKDGVKDLMGMMKGVVGSLADEESPPRQEDIPVDPLAQLATEMGIVPDHTSASAIFKKTKKDTPGRTQGLGSLLEAFSSDLNVEDLQADLDTSIDTGEIKELLGGLLDTIGPLDLDPGNIQNLLQSVMG